MWCAWECCTKASWILSGWHCDHFPGNHVPVPNHHSLDEERFLICSLNLLYHGSRTSWNGKDPQGTKSNSWSCPGQLQGSQHVPKTIVQMFPELWQAQEWPFPGKSVPVLDHSVGEEPFPNVQPELVLTTWSHSPEPCCWSLERRDWCWPSASPKCS